MRHFICGLRVEIRNHSLVCTFNSVSELVERGEIIKIGIEEEKKVNHARFQAHTNQKVKTTDRKRKLDKVEDNQSEEKRGDCAT